MRAELIDPVFGVGVALLCRQEIRVFSKTKKVLPSGTLSETRESGLRVFRRGISIVETCCQLRSSKVDMINWTVVGQLS